MRKRPLIQMLAFTLILTCIPGYASDAASQTASQAVAPKAGQTAVIKVAAGGGSNAVLKRDGTVWCFGIGKEGELGDGSLKKYSGPVKVKGLRDVVDIDASFGVTIALKQDGTVWGWGIQDMGTFGSAYPQICPEPVQIPGLTDMKAIAAGDGYVVALKKDGTVWWIGEVTGSTAAQMKGLKDITAISAMGFHAAALKKDGTVWCWGANYGGQLGNGSIKKDDLSMNSTPGQVKGLTGVIAISAGDLHTLALKKDGTVWVWGSNSDGQLGSGSARGMDTSVPLKVKGLQGIEYIGTGFYSSMAVSKDGTAWCWGNNEYGQFGNGTVKSSITPVKIAGLAGTVDAAGARFQFIALKKDGSVWVAGTNDIGQLGTGDTKNRYYPAKITGLDKLEIRVKLNGESLDFAVEPKKVNESILVPFRTLFEAFGAEVNQNAAATTAEAKKGDTAVTVKVNSAEAFVNGERRTLPVPVQSAGGQVLVPVQFAAESLGVQIEWDAASSTVNLTSDRVPRRFVIDGKLKDWEGIAPVAEDPKGDAAGGAADILSLYAFRNNKTLYLAAKLGGRDPIVDFNIDINQDGQTDYVVFSNWEPGAASILKIVSSDPKPEPGKVAPAVDEVMEMAVPLGYLGNAKNIKVSVAVKHIKNKEESKTYDEIPGWFDVTIE